MKVDVRKIIKSKTNNNDLAKQYFIIYGTNEDDICLIVYKYVLSSDFDLYKDHKLVKTFKDKGLYFIHYSIRLETLMNVNDWIMSLFTVKFK